MLKVWSKGWNNIGHYRLKKKYLNDQPRIQERTKHWDQSQQQDSLSTMMMFKEKKERLNMSKKVVDSQKEEEDRK